jgi:hypothetical protein
MKDEIKFPCLMKSIDGEMIILATGYLHDPCSIGESSINGLVIKSDSRGLYKVGERSAHWGIPFFAEITIDDCLALVKREKIEAKKEIKFPCLMRGIFTELVILATGYCSFSDMGFKGFVVKKDRYYSVGHFAEDWPADAFREVEPDTHIVLLRDEEPA